MRSGSLLTRPLLWVLLFAFVLRLSLFLAIAGHPDRFYSFDSPGYVRVGTNLGEAYQTRGGDLFRLGLLRTPGYPIVIAAGFSLSGNAPWGVILFQIAVALFTVWLTYRLALRLVGPEPALWAALALAIDPISIVLANYLQPETVFTSLVVAGTLLWSRGLQEHSITSGAGAGALFGVAALARPITQYIPVALIPTSLALYAGRWSRRLIFPMALFLAFAIPVGGWIARNASITGVPLLSTADGVSLLYFRAALALSEDEGIPFKEAQDRLKASVREQSRPGMNAAEVSRIERSIGIRYLLDHPGATIEQTVKGAVLTIIGPGRAELLHLLGDPTPTQISGPLQVILITAEVVVYGVILVSAIVGYYLLVRRRKYFALVLLSSLILYFILATIVGSLGYSRYRVPIMPFISILAGYGFATWRRFRSSRKGSRRESHPDQA